MCRTSLLCDTPESSPQANTGGALPNAWSVEIHSASLEDARPDNMCQLPLQPLTPNATNCTEDRPRVNRIHFLENISKRGRGSKRKNATLVEASGSVSPVESLYL